MKPKSGKPEFVIAEDWEWTTTWKDRKRIWRWTLVAANGIEMAHSVAYTSESGCRKGIATLRQMFKDGL